MKTLVSVVMPVYNASKYLEEAIESVLQQTYENFELIIVDDCSKDNSLEIARRYEDQDQRIRVIAGEKNQGVAHVRNRGILEANGDYIALLDCDDVWCDTKLERQVHLIVKEDADLAYCSYDFIDENSNEVLKPFIVPEITNYKKMLASSVISCSTALIESQLLKAHPFKPGFYHEDYLLWMELLSLPVKAVGDPTVLMHYRQVKGSRSNNKRNAAIKRWKIYREALGLGLIESIVAFAAYALHGVIKYYFKC